LSAGDVKTRDAVFQTAVDPWAVPSAVDCSLCFDRQVYFDAKLDALYEKTLCAEVACQVDRIIFPRPRRCRVNGHAVQSDETFPHRDAFNTDRCSLLSPFALAPFR
jgi:hypothetical protein